MTNKFIAVFFIFTMFLTACGGVAEKQTTTTTSEKDSKKEQVENKSENKFSLLIDGKEQGFQPKSSWASHWEKTFSYPVDGKTVTDKSSNTDVIIANYELDFKDGKYSLSKQKIDKPEMLKIAFGFNGEKGTDYETPIKVGEYKIKPGDFMKVGESFNKIDSVDIFHFVDGKEKETSLNGNKMDGVIEITEVKNNTITGKIDVTDGNHTIKGDFSAKGDDSVK